MTGTRGVIAENEKALRRLAELHGDLDALALIQTKLRLPLKTLGGEVGNFYYTGITFEVKKHLWNIASRLASRVESDIIHDKGLLREVIHLAAKGRKA